MARSSNRLDILDRLALAGLLVGLTSYVVPVWDEGRLRLAFWLTFAATLLHIYTSHARADGEHDEVGT